MHHPAGTLNDTYQMFPDVKKKQQPNKQNAEWLRFSQLTHKTTQQDVYNNAAFNRLWHSSACYTLGSESEMTLPLSARVQWRLAEISKSIGLKKKKGRVCSGEVESGTQCR